MVSYERVEPNNNSSVIYLILDGLLEIIEFHVASVGGVEVASDMVLEASHLLRVEGGIQFLLQLIVICK